MSDTTPTTETPTPKEAAEAAPKDQGETPEQTIAALRAALSKANDEAKQNRLKAKEFDEIKQSQMSDLERITAEAQQNKAEAEKARAEALRLRIALKHGISDEDAETFLTGTDEVTLSKQAERLAALSTTAASTPATPKPDLTQGGQGGAPALNSDGLEDALKSKLGIA